MLNHILKFLRIEQLNTFSNSELRKVTLYQIIGDLATKLVAYVCRMWGATLFLLSLLLKDNVYEQPTVRSLKKPTVVIFSVLFLATVVNSTDARADGTAPAAPASLSVTAGDTKATLTFTTPANDGGSSITSYEYQIDGGSWVSTSSTATSINVNGLTNGTTYSFAVRAVNGNGDGVASSSVSGTPDEIPLLSAKFGIAQVFSDRSYEDYRPWGTDHRGILAQSVLDAMVENGRYFAFYQANRHDANEFGFAIFNSNGSKYSEIASDITIRELGDDLITYRTNRGRTNYITPS